MSLDPGGKAFFKHWVQNETKSHKEYDRGQKNSTLGNTNHGRSAEKKEQSLKRQRSRSLSDPQEILTRGEETHDQVIRPLTHKIPASGRGSLHRAASNSDLEAIVNEVITMKKTCLNITREKLDQYNLRLAQVVKGCHNTELYFPFRFGCNEISFSLTTQFQVGINH